MDVTSLLNSSSVAAEQQKSQGERFILPSRNRTPWDAGGYSLPINTSNHTINIGELSTGNEQSMANQKIQKIHCYDSHGTYSEMSPHHKFSDSRSSLSSFTSTTNSTTSSSSNHSRFSSLGTVNSSYRNSFFHNSAVKNSTDLSRSSYSSITPQNKIESHSAPTSPQDTRKFNMASSPTENLDALATLAEQDSSRSPENRDGSQGAPGPEMVDSTDSPKESDSRPGSPSDAMLIRRPDIPHLNTDTSDNGFESDHSSNYRSAPLEYNQTAMQPILHKRNISAPILRRRSRAPASSVGRIPELTPPNSNRLANLPSPLDDEDEDAEGDPATPPPAGSNVEKPPECMYIPNCDTGSQPRKAISHIFGRNKMCTRLIPQSVWVHYCRKHYQRSRYRNPKEYAKLQCDLVQQQIRRVHDWSQQNQRRGEPGTIIDWGLSVRKREQKRLDELKGSSRKRRASAIDGENEGEEDEEPPRPPTAVPDWLLHVIGGGYKTEQILEIFNRLHQEVLDDHLPCFPDIEILPNITVDSDQPKSPKGYAKRKVSSAGHKRSKSVGVGAMKNQNSSSPSKPDRRMSQPVIFQSQNTAEVPVYNTALKRRRANPSDVNLQYSNMQFAPLPADVERRRVSFQPAFTGFERIDEDHQAAAGDNNFESPHRRQYRSSSVYQSPLAAPVARPLGIHQNQVATQLQQMETGSPSFGMNGSMDMSMGMHGMHGRGSRPFHQRSRSDMILPRTANQPNLMNRTAMQPNLMSSSQQFNGNVEFTTPQYQQSGFTQSQLNESRQQHGVRQNSYGMQQHGRRQFAPQQQFVQPQQFRQESPTNGGVGNSPITGPVGQRNNSTPQQGSQSNASRVQNSQMRGNQMLEESTRRR
ncbi:hypothetical protein NHQ30_004212 [Ciborinia camelliae]|nr:hypothetical protein NHQ30_004212 [Ciborinia camelliae]